MQSDTHTTAGLIAVFMWNGQSPTDASLARPQNIVSQAISTTRDPPAARALELMLACLNQVLTT